MSTPNNPPPLSPTATPAQRAAWAKAHGSAAYAKAKAEAAIPKTLPPKPDFKGRAAYCDAYGLEAFRAAVALEDQGVDHAHIAPPNR